MTGPGWAYHRYRCRFRGAYGRRDAAYRDLGRIAPSVADRKPRRGARQIGDVGYPVAVQPLAVRRGNAQRHRNHARSAAPRRPDDKNGRQTGRERVGQYVETLVVAASFKNKYHRPIHLLDSHSTI